MRVSNMCHESRVAVKSRVKSLVSSPHASTAHVSELRMPPVLAIHVETSPGLLCPCRMLIHEFLIIKIPTPARGAVHTHPSCSVSVGEVSPLEHEIGYNPMEKFATRASLGRAFTSISGGSMINTPFRQEATRKRAQT